MSVDTRYASVIPQMASVGHNPGAWPWLGYKGFYSESDHDSSGSGTLGLPPTLSSAPEEATQPRFTCTGGNQP